MDPDRSFRAQAECSSTSEWWKLMRGFVPIQMAHALSKDERNTGRPFREVFLVYLEAGAIIPVSAEARREVEDTLSERRRGSTG